MNGTRLSLSAAERSFAPWQPAPRGGAPATLIIPSSRRCFNPGQLLFITPPFGLIPERAAQLSTPACKPNWISVTKLYKEGVGAILRELRIGADDPNFDKYNSRLNRLYTQKESYLYPIQIIRGKSYDEVTDIFIRVNSSGTRLRGSDLALAQITSTWPGSMRLLESFVDDCITGGFYLDENFLVRCLVCVATQQAKLENIGRVPMATLRRNWELTKNGVQRTVNFLKNCAFVDSTALLPSPILLAPLVYYSSSRDVSNATAAENGFLYWFYNAAIWGRYSASMETRLTQDLSAMRDKQPWVTLTNNIWQGANQSVVHYSS